MNTGKRTGKGAARLMALLLLSSLGSGSLAGALASESTPASVSDARLFMREFREKGALRFYDATEEELRLGRFEAAFLRYRFLKARVGGDPAYRPLTAMVDHRLRFLAGQMGLAGAEVPPLKTARSRLPQPAPQPPRSATEPAAGKTAGPDKSQAPPPSASEPFMPSPGAPPPPSQAASTAGPAPPETASPAGPASQESAPTEVADKKTPEAPSTPSPPPSRWQRLKARLFFWRK